MLTKTELVFWTKNITNYNLAVAHCHEIPEQNTAIFYGTKLEPGFEMKCENGKIKFEKIN